VRFRKRFSLPLDDGGRRPLCSSDTPLPACPTGRKEAQMMKLFLTETTVRVNAGPWVVTA
jgi:hypothetical protein